MAPPLTGVPKALRKTFDVQKRVTNVDARGNSKIEYVSIDTMQAVMADLSTGERLRWAQLQHPISHTVAARGGPIALPGDRLVFNGRNFYIQGVQNPGEMSLWTTYECEERPDA